MIDTGHPIKPSRPQGFSNPIQNDDRKSFQSIQKAGINLVVITPRRRVKFKQSRVYFRRGKMKRIPLAILFLTTACAHNSIHDRKPSSTSEAFKEGLDPQFEKPWKGDIATENRSLQDLGKVIGNYVAEQAKAHQAWREELVKLERQDENKLSNNQKKRKASLQIVLNDLPNSKGLATRDVHRRPQACLAATLKIDPNLAAENQKGLFLPGAEYDAIVRFSNGNPRNLPDIAPDARGMAVKLLPQGILTKDSDNYFKIIPNQISALELNEKGLLDILAINFPVFFVNDPEKYVKINQAFLHPTNDPTSATDPNSLAYKFYEGLSVFFKGMNEWERELALDVNGSIILNPLHEEYWSMMSYRFGDERDSSKTAIKYKWTPCEQNLPKGGSPEWTKNHDYAKIYTQVKSFIGLPIPKEVGNELSKEENRYYLRDSLLFSLNHPMADQVRGTIFPKKCFALQIQRYIDEDNTPVEDTTQIWLENETQQKFWAKKFADHGGAPRGAIQRRNFILSRKIPKPITVATLELEDISNETYRSVTESKRTTNTSVCENLSFDPWNNVPSAHKPLGIVGRMRKFAYAGSKHQRHKLNNVSDVGQ